ncbi:MAG: biopolymer transporter ExbD [Phycisphaerales bacterium]|nr:biopolymer transporter ExbD [Phycisphaerales bacterium]
MLSLRRPEPEARIELMPLIDVIFLILTFFIYAMVLMVQVDVMPVPMESYISGESAEPVPATSITLDLNGQVYLGQEPVEVGQMLPAIEQLLVEKPDTVIYLVLAAGDGEVDRGPILTTLWDHLRESGIEIKLVGSPQEAMPTNVPTPDATP